MNAEGYRQFEADLLNVKGETVEESAKDYIDLVVELFQNCRDSGLKGLGESDALARVYNMMINVMAFNEAYAKDKNLNMVDWINDNCE